MRVEGGGGNGVQEIVRLYCSYGLGEGNGEATNSRGRLSMAAVQGEKVRERRESVGE